MSTYIYGSASLAHETAQLSLANRPVLHLGIKSEQLSLLLLYETANRGGGKLESQCLRLTERDRKRAVRLLERGCKSNAVYSMNGMHFPKMKNKEERNEYAQELQIMLMVNYKAEMQVVEEFSGGVGGFLQTLL
jgi:meiotic recombination protein SPO11